MTAYQRRALALAIHAWQKELRTPNEKVKGGLRQVYSSYNKKLLSTFEIREISFQNVDMRETPSYFQFFSENMRRGETRLKSENDPSEEGYNRELRIYTPLTTSYVEGQDERGYRFSAWVESWNKVKIKDEQHDKIFSYDLVL